jgi:hypothetical protein
MLFKISTRSLMLGAVLFGLSLTPVYADSNNGDIPHGTGPADMTTGETGYTGHAAEDGGAGENGGLVNSEVGGSSSGGSNGAIAYSIGGNGGDGGTAIAGDGEGREAEKGGNGGAGGNGGEVTMTVTGEIQGGVAAGSRGGDGGKGGEGISGNPGVAGGIDGQGGNGGDVELTIKANGSVVGDVLAVSQGGEGGTHGGDVTVTISGYVDGKVETASEGVGNAAGKIQVVIDGGVVTGVISAETNNEESSLAFKFDVADRTEFNAATLALTGSGAEGTVTINGKGYEWRGFSTLVNLLSYVGPEDKVVVSVKETTNENPTTTVGDPVAAPKTVAKQEEEPAKPKIVAGIEVIQGKPEMAKCSGGSEIRTVRLDDGSVVVIHHKSGADTLIGQLEGGEFHRASDAPDWTVQVGDSGKTVSVSDASGTALSNCSFS